MDWFLQQINDIKKIKKEREGTVINFKRLKRRIKKMQRAELHRILVQTYQCSRDNGEILSTEDTQKPMFLFLDGMVL